MSTITTLPTIPIPGVPETYHRVADDSRRNRWRINRNEIVLVPVRDPKRDRMAFVKVEAASFDKLPAWVRNTAWSLAKDGGASPSDLSRFSVRTGTGKSQVALARIIMGAKPGEYVRNCSGDRLDLRTTNLRLKGGAMGKRAKRNDLALAMAVSTRVLGRATRTRKEAA